MGNSEFYSYFDGDWDDHDELAWNEFDWQQYIQKNTSEITKFLDCYHRLKSKENHFEEIAQFMGWYREEWSNSDFFDETLPENFDFLDELNSPSARLEPYTVHQHPVYIVTHGLYLSLFKTWGEFTLKNQRLISPFFASQFSTALHIGEFNAIMAINALDMADYNLCICHFKHALSALNQTLMLLDKLSENCRSLTEFKSDFNTLLFDLREVWLRVMTDCRDEYKSRNNDSDEA